MTRLHTDRLAVVIAIAILAAILFLCLPGLARRRDKRTV